MTEGPGNKSYKSGEAAVSSQGATSVIEFPDMAAAQSALQSESYKAILPGRTENSTGPIVLVGGLDHTAH